MYQCTMLHNLYIFQNLNKIKLHTYLSLFEVFFLMWIAFKVFTEFVTILLLFHIFVFLAARHVGS